jgi:hypothetical protein
LAQDSISGGEVSEYEYGQLREKPSEITVLWDASYSMHRRDIAKEVALLDAYFNYLKNVTVKLQIFGYELDEPRNYTIENGKWDDLKNRLIAVQYDGTVGTFVPDRLEAGSFTLLVTDGIGFPIGPDRNWRGTVFAINSAKIANHTFLEELATSREGNYLPLYFIVDMEEALAPLKSIRSQMKYNYTQENSVIRHIRGNVTDFEDPLSNVSVAVKNSDRNTRTNRYGDFTIAASTSDILEFSAPGRESTTAIVNASTRLLKVTMPMGVKVLDEVVLEQDAAQKGLEEPLHEDVSTNFGPLDAHKSGFAIKQIDGERLSPSAQTITDALVGKFAGVRIVGGSGPNARVMLRVGSRFFAAWEVDGLLYPPENPPLHINVQNIRNITVMQGSWAAARYGRMAAGGIIMVRTISQDIHNNRQLDQVAGLRKNIYSQDAVTLVQKVSGLPGYILMLDAEDTADNAYVQYLTVRSQYDHRPDFFYDTYRWFKQTYPSSGYANRILSNIRELFPGDATALKMEAFVLEEQGLLEEAREVYRQIYKVQPGPQTLRDLANINIKAGDIKRGWRLYHLYLSQNDSLLNYGTDRLLRTEMIDLIRNHAELLDVKDTQLDLDSEVSDLMLGVEWNNANARFELQFVGPQGLFYTWDNSNYMPKSDTLDGSLSDGFEIADLTKGKWLVNIKYLGNQEEISTYLKFSLKDRKRGTEWIKSIKLDKENVKFRFLEINGEQVVTLIN